MRGWPIPAEPWPVILGRELVGVFAIDEWQALDGVVRFRGRLLVEPEVAMSLLSQRVAPYGYAPVIRSPEEITLIRLHTTKSGRETATWRSWWLNLALFVATVLTTLFVGAIMEGAQPLADPWSLLQGVPFSASLLLILGFHELGHYLAARAYGVQVSLPYFIPLPLPPMGTMGAVIRMRSPIPNRKVLFDIGVAGPLLGMLLAVPVIAIGIMLSPVKPVSGVVLQEGNSLAYLFLKWLIKGPIPDGSDVMLHPMALAGWLGFFVTALNLMPLSQLDGGHIVYAVLGRGHRKIVWVFLGVLVLLYLVSRWEGWLVWVGLSVALGLKHPPPLDDLTPLDPPRRFLALIALGLLVVLLTPRPFAIYEF
ncbi:MAG TPA: site-2 protease family protein [Candidatus Methylomirabilis sp.]|nr:site-2 protease family protein [Candidatus Methylomirabilis sp.]